MEVKMEVKEEVKEDYSCTKCITPCEA